MRLPHSLRSFAMTAFLL